MFALFAADGRCVATLEAGLVPIVLDAAPAQVGAIRAVAVDTGWRGRGLFRALTDAALASIDASSATSLLFTAEPALYHPFGFTGLAQHAFVGRAPSVLEGGAPARLLDLDRTADREHLARLYADRAPLSRHCALQIDWPQFVANVEADDALRVTYCPDLAAAIVYERDANMLVVADIVAVRMPTLAQVLGRIAPDASHVRTLFPPDGLAWTGDPHPDDTGLMIRGSVPHAMTQPFMLPPTVEF